MSRNETLIIFDWDGTLYDSLSAIVEAFQRSCRDLGFAPPDAGRIRHTIGLSVPESIRFFLPRIDEPDLNLLVESYRRNYLALVESIPLFGGVKESLTYLNQQGILLAVATGKSRAGLERAFTHTGLGPLFQASRCSDECTPKPDPQMVLEIMEQLHCGQDQTLLIGDTTHDAIMARRAGIAFLGVPYGAHPVEKMRQEGVPVLSESLFDFCRRNY